MTNGSGKIVKYINNAGELTEGLVYNDRPGINGKLAIYKDRNTLLCVIDPKRVKVIGFFD